MFCQFCIYAILLILIYKILDRVVRIPWIKNYKDRYVLVTGCDTGFGNSLAKRLDGLRCHVFAGCLTEKGETELKKVSSERLNVVPLDVTKKESVRNAFNYVKSKLPKDKGLHGIVNNAGVLLSCGPPDWLTIEDFRNNSEVNLWGMIDVTLTFLPLVKIEKGRVVNMSSLTGRVTFPLSIPYSISKYGVESFTYGLRRSLHGFGCKAITIEPGTHQTSIVTAESIARLVREEWNKTTPEIKEEYGEEWMQSLVTTMKEALRSKSTSNLDGVVDAYVHALFGRFPRARYVVGSDAKIIMALELLPEWLSDWIFRTMVGERKRPLAVAFQTKK